jgi:hypothetical protein
MAIERFEDLILEFNNLIPDDWCEIMIDWFEENPDLQLNGRVSDNADDQEVQPLFKVSTQSIIPFESPLAELMSKICNICYDNYINIVKESPNQCICFRDYSIRVYNKDNGFFKTHVDQGAGGTVTRLFAIILYLNDVEHGGETEFPTFNKKIKPERGKVLMFPCNYMYPHGGNMPISGSKYIATAFINFVTEDSLQQS